MKDKQLGAALAEVCEQKLLAKSTSLPADFEFSKCFEDKMRKIIVCEKGSKLFSLSQRYLLPPRALL